MRWHKRPGARDDGYEHRPDLVSEAPDGSLSFDAARFEERMARNRRLRRENWRIVWWAIHISEVDFAQFYFTTVTNGFGPRKPGEPYLTVFPCQLGFFLDPITIGHAGRDCGKTMSMRITLMQRMVCYPNSSAMFTSHDQAHVKPRVNEVMRDLDTHPVLSLLVDKSEGARNRDFPMWQYMENGFVLYGLSGGKTEQQAAAVESPHVVAFFCDETQDYSKPGFRKVQNAIRDIESHLHEGACFKAYGVNSDGKMNTPFYSLAHEMWPYNEHVFRVASWLVPYYTLQSHAKNLQMPGAQGDIDSPAFKQQIRGLLGEKTTGTFRREDYQLARQLFDVLGCRYRFIRIGRRAWENSNGDFAGLLGELMEPSAERPAHRCVLSMDYGTTAPSELGVWYELDHPGGPGKGAVWALYNRVQMLGLTGPAQVQILDWLMDVLRPEFLSVDSTGSTDVVYSAMATSDDPRYVGPAKNYKERVFPARWDMNVEIDYVDEEPPPGIKNRKKLVAGRTIWAILAHANVFATDEIGRLMSEGRLAIPDDDLMFKEFMSLITRDDGRHVRYTGNDQHVISMYRCLTLLLHEKYAKADLAAKALRLRSFHEPVGHFFFVPSGV